MRRGEIPVAAQGSGGGHQPLLENVAGGGGLTRLVKAGSASGVAATDTQDLRLVLVFVQLEDDSVVADADAERLGGHVTEAPDDGEGAHEVDAGGGDRFSKPSRAGGCG